MSTGSFAEHDSPSDDDEIELGFVTKRTFELLEQEEPFIERQFKNLTSLGVEQLFLWTENIKEVVGPIMLSEAEVGVDCVKDFIRLDWMPQLVGRQRLMIGPVDYDFPTNSCQNVNTTNLTSAGSTARKDVSLSSQSKSAALDFAANICQNVNTNNLSAASLLQRSSPTSRKDVSLSCQSESTVLDFAAKGGHNVSASNLLSAGPSLMRDVYLACQSESGIKEPATFVAGKTSKRKDESALNPINPTPNTQSLGSCAIKSYSTRESKLLAQKKIPGRETTGILRERLINPRLQKSFFDRYQEAESKKKRAEVEKRQDEEYESITSGTIFLVPVSHPDFVEQYSASGKRPESPIFLDESDYFENEDFADDEIQDSSIMLDKSDNFVKDDVPDDEIREGPVSMVHEESTAHNDLMEICDSPEIEPTLNEKPLLAHKWDDREPENAPSIHTVDDKDCENEIEVEARDPYPASDSKVCDDDAPASTNESRDEASADHSFMESMSTDIQFQRSKSLLYSMRAQNRRLDQLAEQLKNFSSKYTFGASGDDLSTDHSATYSSRGSSFFASASHHKPDFELSKQASFRFDEKSLVSSSDVHTHGGDSSIANSSIDTDGDRDESQSTFHNEFMTSSDRATISVKKVEKDPVEVSKLFRTRPLLGPTFKSSPVFPKM
jgi:hypothetical protein